MDLQSQLQQEFPFLDGTLIAAMISDIDPTPHALHPLRRQLNLLSFDAERLSLASGDESELPSAPGSTSWIDPPSETPTSSSSDSAWLCTREYNDIFRFLETAFPNVKTVDIHNALRFAVSGAPGDQTIDVDEVVHSLMSSEDLYEQEERGLGLFGDIDTQQAQVAPEITSRKKKRKFEGRTLQLNDLRQQHHISPSIKSSGHPALGTGAMQLNTWTQLSSLDSYLTSLVPDCPQNYFISYFHNKSYATPSAAVRAALSRLCRPDVLENVDDTDVIPLLEPILDKFDGLADFTLEEKDRLIDDIRIALHLCGAPDHAHQLVTRLVELDLDERGGMSQGLYHTTLELNPSPSSSLPSTPQSSKRPLERRNQGYLGEENRSTKTSNQPQDADAWTTIPVREKPSPHPLAEFIPAYKLKNGQNDHTSSNAAAHFGALEKQARARRKEALLQASHLWRKNRKNSGAAIALLFAERASRYAQESQDYGRRRAKAVVVANQRRGLDGHLTIDLHGLTMEEAKFVVREILANGKDGHSEERPLHIITGVGKHSANKVGVLRPAVLAMLAEDGWGRITKLEGQIIVRGRS